ncbi:SGNH/GDSL hydrolase family protein [Paraferrimonas sp. SM1919]|uniref:SGNH/GDSL hydrolase family protein n=1 Tax=Paraferrimonas sp. SM1919 TaxID=2662263 RepID=UPI0013D6805C|nr:SGNH/GDSL hydrolase family protein [Paraferrimonas sp. SM1919]
MMKQYLLSLMALAAPVAAIEAPAPFQNNDNIIFIGDSITHGGSYHKQVYLYYATRYPELNLSYVNAGISGDTAPGTLKRYSEDIQVHNANKAFIMLGMNDVNRPHYDKLPQTAAERSKRRAQQAKSLHNYLSAMDTLISKLKADGVEVGLILPSIYDETATLAKPINVGANLELGVYSYSLLQLAQQHDLSVVDFYNPMSALNAKLQQNDPEATLVSNDRVHPEQDGHFVMAYEFIKQTLPQGKVANINIDLSAQTINSDGDCELNSKGSSSDKISFSCTLTALPFPSHNGIKRALEWTSFNQDYNQLPLTVKGLTQGQYQLSIDGNKVASFSSSELENSVNLSAFAHTPMYQQALEVRRLNDKRAQLAGTLRSIALVQHTMVDNPDCIPADNTLSIDKALHQCLQKSIDKPWYGYLSSEVNKYNEFNPKKQSIRAQINDLFEQINRVNKPKQHSYALTRKP